MRGRLHIIGAGLAGLSAAVAARAQGWRVEIHEAAGQAGGRCRSYHDAALGCRIDNGNHLILAANVATRAYAAAIGAADTLASPETPGIDFADLATGERWRLDPNPGLIPWWVLAPRRRVPGTRALDYLSALALAWPGDRPIARRMDTTSTLFRRLWEPLFVAVVNTPLDEAAAAPMWRVLVELFGRGGWSMAPLLPRVGLSESLVDPALAHLTSGGAALRLNHRLRALATDGERVTGLDFGGETIDLDAGDGVILAVPAPVAGDLLPGLAVPRTFSSILNAHYRIDPPTGARIMGVIGGTAEWIFPKPGLLSVTVSAADRLIDRDREDLARLLWRDVARVHGLDPDNPPPWQIVKEKRATFRATPAEIARRPGPRGPFRNLALAGDWTATALPATIEGAIRSGVAAAALASRRDFG